MRLKNCLPQLDAFPKAYQRAESRGTKTRFDRRMQVWAQIVRPNRAMPRFYSAHDTEILFYDSRRECKWVALTNNRLASDADIYTVWVGAKW